MLLVSLVTQLSPEDSMFPQEVAVAGSVGSGVICGAGMDVYVERILSETWFLSIVFPPL